ncbi:MAG: class I SAM-dependent methyltransferase [Thermodesulfobacteriota bacterium]
MKRLLRRCAPIVDVFISPLVFISALVLLCVRRAGLQRMRTSKRIFHRIGIFPVRDHYFEPLFNPIHLKRSLREDRELRGIDWNLPGQFDLLEEFHFNRELEGFPIEKDGDLKFYYKNGCFGSADADYLYNILRLYQPKKIIEIGSGYSTLVAVEAIRKNREEESSYSCEQICIEPYEASWLEKLNITLIRDLLENVDKKIFATLQKNDVLFIDSTHIIRPQGDVLCEYLEILPLLKPGVLIHVHDIFTPKDYLDEIVIENVWLWNEQYLVEAFLSFNKEFKIIGALNFLSHHYRDRLSAKCPVLKTGLNLGEPSSLWLTRM